MPAILITGAAGQLGGELAALAWPASFRVLTPPRSVLDLASPASIHAFFAREDIALVLNAAAYTAVDAAESAPAAAFALNARAPALLAAAARRAGAGFIHVSTDFVFDGARDGAYEEGDVLAPLNIYGASKAAGELLVRQAHPTALIVRTAWVFSARRANFVKTMLRLAKDRPSLSVVADQRGCPTAAGDLARALQTLALRQEAPSGVLHLVNDGEASWCDLAAAVMEQARRRGAPAPPVTPIETKDYPTPARRPANSRLSTRRAAQDFGLKLRPWREAVAEVVDQVLNEEKAGQA